MCGAERLLWAKAPEAAVCLLLAVDSGFSGRTSGFLPSLSMWWGPSSPGSERYRRSASERKWTPPLGSAAAGTGSAAGSATPLGPGTSEEVMWAFWKNWAEWQSKESDLTGCSVLMSAFGAKWLGVFTGALLLRFNSCIVSEKQTSYFIPTLWRS